MTTITLTSPFSRPLAWVYELPFQILRINPYSPKHKHYVYEGGSVVYKGEPSPGSDPCVLGGVLVGRGELNNGYSYIWDDGNRINSADVYLDGVDPNEDYLIAFVPGVDYFWFGWPLYNSYSGGNHRYIRFRKYSSLDASMVHELVIDAKTMFGFSSYQWCQNFTFKAVGDKILIAAYYDNGAGVAYSSVVYGLIDAVTGAAIHTEELQYDGALATIYDEAKIKHIGLTSDRAYMNGYAFDHDGNPKGATPFADMNGFAGDGPNNFSIFAADDYKVGFGESGYDYNSYYDSSNDDVFNVTEYRITKGGPGVDDTYTLGNEYGLLITPGPGVYLGLYEDLASFTLSF